MEGNFMDKVRSFLGLHHGTPRNDFRNPIWGSDDDDDGDELYSEQQLMPTEADLHREFTRHMHDIFKSFGGMFGDMRSFFQDDFKSIIHDESLHSLPNVGLDNLPEGEQMDSNSIRDYYLKPGYHSRLPAGDDRKDVDLDGKISSQEISGLLKRKDNGQQLPESHFDSSLVPGRSFCQTIITTSITMPDGSVETRRIVKKGNEVVEETRTMGPDPRNPGNPNLNTISSHTGIILSELMSLFKNTH